VVPPGGLGLPEAGSQDAPWQSAQAPKKTKLFIVTA
jgi:hypothetical protein